MSGLAKVPVRAVIALAAVVTVYLVTGRGYAMHVHWGADRLFELSPAAHP